MATVKASGRTCIFVFLCADTNVNPFVYTAGVVSNVGLAVNAKLGAGRSAANAVSDNDIVVGNLNGTDTAFVYSNGTVTQIADLANGSFPFPGIGRTATAASTTAIVGAFDADVPFVGISVA